MQGRYLNKKGLCNVLGVSIGKVELLMKEGELPYIKLGRNVRFDIRDIDEFLTKKKVMHCEF